MSFRPQTYFLVVGSVISLSVVAITCQSAVAHQMDEWQLLPRPERVTELYFTDYRDTPRSGLAQTVAFTVHNIEHRTTTYRYKIVIQEDADNKERLMAEGSFTLAHDHSLVTTKNITPTTSGKRSSMKVNLEYEGIVRGTRAPTDQKQSIHYWFNDGKEKHEDT